MQRLEWHCHSKSDSGAPYKAILRHGQSAGKEMANSAVFNLRRNAFYYEILLHVQHIQRNSYETMPLYRFKYRPCHCHYSFECWVGIALLLKGWVWVYLQLVSRLQTAPMRCWPHSTWRKSVIREWSSSCCRRCWHFSALSSSLWRPVCSSTSAPNQSRWQMPLLLVSYLAIQQKTIICENQVCNETNNWSSDNDNRHFAGAIKTRAWKHALWHSSFRLTHDLWVGVGQT